MPDGLASWHESPVDTTYFHYLHGLSCPSVTFCVALDNGGTLFVTHDPAAARATWRKASVGEGGDVAYVVISCPTARVCGLTVGGLNVISSADPSGGSGAWIATAVAPAPPTVGPAVLTTIACPSTAACLAFDTAGGLRIGGRTPPPSTRTIGAALAAQLTPTGASAHLRTIVAAGRYTFTFVSPASGRLRIRWFIGHRIIATAGMAFGASETQRVMLKLVNNGRATLRHRRRATVQVLAGFTESGRAPITERTRITLRA